MSRERTIFSAEQWARLEAAQVTNLSGQSIKLGDLYRERAIVVIFVRHFGCLFCREQVAEVRTMLPEIRARGAELVVIGNGALHFARAFREDLAIDFEVYTDPSLEVYRAAQLERGLGTLLRPAVFARALSSLRKGYRQAALQGDPLQQGGTLVIGPGNRIALHYISHSAGDHASLESIRAALPERPSSTGAHA